MKGQNARTAMYPDHKIKELSGTGKIKFPAKTKRNK
jgi:hypothetical protein